jgi:hypothetical protein
MSPGLLVAGLVGCLAGPPCDRLRACPGSSGTGPHYPNRPEISSGFTFYYPRKPIGYRASGRTGSSSGFSGFGLGFYAQANPWIKLAY